MRERRHADDSRFEGGCEPGRSGRAPAAASTCSATSRPRSSRDSKTPPTAPVPRRSPPWRTPERSTLRRSRAVTSRGVYGRPVTVAELRQKDDDRVRRQRKTRGRRGPAVAGPTRSPRTVALRPSTGLRAPVARNVLSRSDAPVITIMRWASGCMRRARSRVPRTSSGAITPARPEGARGSPGRRRSPGTRAARRARSSRRGERRNRSAGRVKVTTTSIRRPAYFLASKAGNSGSRLSAGKRWKSRGSEKRATRRAPALSRASRASHRRWRGRLAGRDRIR